VLFVLCTVLLSLFIAYSHRIEEFNLRELKVTLRELKETEASIKELAAAIVELSESDDHAIMVETFDEERKRNAINNIKRFTT
jgi:nitrate reductase assembly molybdenum cofactor insertion protein NarJ